MTSGTLPEPSPPSRPARNRRGPGIVALVVAALAIGLFVALPFVRGLGDRTGGVQSSNAELAVSQTARVLEPGDRVCVEDVVVPETGRQVRTFPGYTAKTAPRLLFTVADATGEKRVRRRVDGYPPNVPLDVFIGGGWDTDAAKLCVRNVGRSGVSLADARGPFAGGDPAIRVDILGAGKPRHVEMLGTALERAGLFKAGFVSPGVIVVLGLLVLALTGLVLRLALREPTEEGATGDAPAASGDEGDDR